MILFKYRLNLGPSQKKVLTPFNGREASLWGKALENQPKQRFFMELNKA
jgi:hypothetical protein